MTDIENIVINGGGSLILNMYGALKQSNKLKMWEYDKIKSYYGTSAGAILGLLMAIRFDWDDLDNFIINRPWQNVLKFNVLEIYDYYVNNGIADKNFMYDFFTPLFKAKDLEIDMTFAQLTEQLKTNLHVYATNFTTFEIKEFSAELTPDVKVIDAVYASSAVPIAFRPIKIGEEIYIDGSIYINYPLVKCLEKNINPQTIFGIKNKLSNDAYSMKEEMTMFEYMSQILNMLLTKTQVETPKDIKIGNEIQITACLSDIGNFFKMASCDVIRRTAIEKGIEDANNLYGRVNEII
jgi:predicted acylesterase/phospholipase RssA